MASEIVSRSRVMVLDGNRAIAYAVWLCKPDVIAAYPITPQTPLLEQLYRFHDDGLLDAELVEVEGETSSIGALIGASAAGGRTFTSTTGAGLAFMFDGYFFAAADRLPIVMAVATREMSPPHTVMGSQQDILSFKDAGWIQVHCENCQEIFDSIIMAYRLAEDKDVLLPVNVCYDGFYLSHLTERVDVPSQEDVDRFLAPTTQYERVKLDPRKPLNCPTYAIGELMAEYRHKHCAALDRAKKKIDQIDRDFHAMFGRSYGGQIEEYRADDAEIVLLTMGSCSGTAKAVIDQKRSEGLKVGLIKVRYFRPFPRERLIRALAGKKAAGIVDRNVCFGWGCGHLYLEVKALMNELRHPMPLADFIDGLSGGDITAEHLVRAVDTTLTASQGKPYQEVTWLPLE
jgi:pyruvate/2-oxoacid:ferredoxin oxidoreductase alpha subunit